MISASRLAQIAVSWFRADPPPQKQNDLTPPPPPRAPITGLLVSEGALVPVFGDNIAAAFSEMYESHGSDLGRLVYGHAYITRTPVCEATHYRLSKGEVLVRECTIKALPQEAP